MNLLVYEIDPFLTDRSPMPYAFPTNSRWLVGGAQVFRFLAGVKVVPQILGVAGGIHRVDLILEQFAHTVGGHFMQHLHTTLTEQFPTCVYGVEYEGEVLTAEGFLVIGAMEKIVRLLMKHGENDHIVGDEGEEQGAIRFAHPLGLLNTAEFVGLAVQVIQRAKEKHNVKGVVRVAAEVQGVALRQVDVVLWGQFGPESCDVGLRQLQSRYLVALSGEIQAIFSSPGSDIQSWPPE